MPQRSENDRPTPEPARFDATKPPRTVNDLLDVHHEFYTTRGTLDIFKALQNANLFRKGVTWEQAEPSIRQGLNETNQNFQEALNPELREAVDRIELPFTQSLSRETP
jgi:hypothetical protein